VDIPVIGSLNGVTSSGWTSYARAIQDAGGAAIELNIYYIAADPHATGRKSSNGTSTSCARSRTR
jgi:dihydroorotate dehydrogenase (fumarate)